MNINRGQIYLAVLDPVVGKEISKTRPVVIVSNNKNNEFSGIRGTSLNTQITQSSR